VIPEHASHCSFMWIGQENSSLAQELTVFWTWRLILITEIF